MVCILSQCRNICYELAKYTLALTHWGRVTHICVGNLAIIGSDNGLASGRRQAIIWTNAKILLIGPLWKNFSEILIEIPTFSFKKMRLKVSSAKGRPFCLGLNVLTTNCSTCVSNTIHMSSLEIYMNELHIFHTCQGYSGDTSIISLVLLNLF